MKNDVIVCTKSTVPVGTNDQIREMIHSHKPTNLYAEVVSNPEFLREGSAVVDFFYGDRIVIGADCSKAVALIEQIYLPLEIPIIKTDIKSAEMIKYAANAFLATKISFINEIATICEKVGANIDEVTNGIGKDQTDWSLFSASRNWIWRFLFSKRYESACSTRWKCATLHLIFYRLLLK